MRRELTWALAVVLSAPCAWPQGTVRRVAAADEGALREWVARMDSGVAAGQLRLRRTQADTLLPGRAHERYEQRYKGVRVWGGEIARQQEQGHTLSVLGTLYEGIDLDANPKLAADDAKRVVEAAAGVRLGPELDPELVVLPLRDGSGYALTWHLTAITPSDVRAYFVDARDGTIRFDYSDMQSDSAVGQGHGVLGDLKKISTDSQAGGFSAFDRLRPPAIFTYDLKGNFQKLIDYFNGFRTITGADLATDADNDWTDGAVVDAHVYAGYTYDYYYKRFGRHGLDNADRFVYGFVHPVQRETYGSYPPAIVGQYFANAFYAGSGVIVYGDGLPPGVTYGGLPFGYFSGALDVVAHELTHGVTAFSSGLVYLDESGALNEAFSDIMGTSVEFFFQDRGNGPLQSDWLHAENVSPPAGYRSLADPARFGQPDHYSKRSLGTFDNGYVHTNSGIANHAFYLAVEGGTNRTSGLSVRGVGFENREQVEKAFYRGFTFMLTPAANFSQARSATIQAARDLYGAGSTTERALTEAWAAVGVL